MRKKEAQAYLNEFYRNQYQHNYDNFSALGNWLRYTFGWFQNRELKALSSYIQDQQNDVELSKTELLALAQATTPANLESAATERTPLTSRTTSSNPATSSTLNQLGLLIARLVGMIESKVKVRDARKHDLTSVRVDMNVFPGAGAGVAAGAGAGAGAGARTPTANTEITLGDLHGNALKLIYFLIREGAITGVTEEDYTRLRTIYAKKVDDLTEVDLQQFKEIIHKIRLPANPAERVKLVRLIGDVLADRGQNDYFTLLILKKLRDIGLAVEIELSNHDFGFLQHFSLPTAASSDARFEKDLFGPDCDVSSVNLAALLNRNNWPTAGFREALRTEVAEALDVYHSSVKLVGYTLSPDQKHIAIYTHAPVGLETIRALAAYFGVEFKDGTARELANTLDEINREGMNKLRALDAAQLAAERARCPALERLIWARYTRNSGFHSAVEGSSSMLLDRPYCRQQNDGSFYTLSFVHGHTEGGASSHVYNLDSILGKILSQTSGPYLCYRSTSQAAPVAPHLPAAAPVVAAVRVSPVLGAPAVEPITPSVDRSGDDSEGRVGTSMPLANPGYAEPSADGPAVAAPATSAHGANPGIDLAKTIHPYIRPSGEPRPDEDETTPPPEGFRGY